ncbi:hypothetical protein M0R45_008745 [Rubus argutus]|uniref:Uncharacterized protein n=1 Tax=Rubus argutus TaxID=59490 RepID=A0AAW1Y1M7_RUBAR
MMNSQSNNTPENTQNSTPNGPPCPNALPIEPSLTQLGTATPAVPLAPTPPTALNEKKRKPAKNASDVWQHFNRVDVAEGEDPRCTSEQKKGQSGSSGATQGGTEAGGSSQVTDLTKD